MSGGAPWERRQVGPGFSFRGSTLQNTLQGTLQNTLQGNTLQSTLQSTLQNTLQGNTFQSTLQKTLQINGKSNNKGHTAKHISRHTALQDNVFSMNSANTLESSLSDALSAKAL